MKKMMLILVVFICLLSGCASEEGIDGAIVVIDGRIFELQHRFLDIYLLYRLDSKKFEKTQAVIDAIKAR